MTAGGLRTLVGTLAACLGLVCGAGLPAASAATVAGVAGSTGAAPAPVSMSSGQALSGERLEALTREVASELRCVVCQGLSIQDSPSELAREMKAVVRDQLAAGRTPEQVKQYFVDTYGEWILLEPEPVGFNLAVYVLPVLAFGTGIVIIVIALRRWTRAPTDASDATAPGGA